MRILDSLRYLTRLLPVVAALIAGAVVLAPPAGADDRPGRTAYHGASGSAHRGCTQRGAQGASGKERADPRDQEQAGGPQQTGSGPHCRSPDGATCRPFTRFALHSVIDPLFIDPVLVGDDLAMLVAMTIEVSDIVGGVAA